MILRSNLYLNAVLSVYIIAISVPSFAQSTAPSSVVPQTLRPDTKSNEVPIDVPQSNGLTVPSGVEGMRITLDSIDVQSGYIEVAAQTSAITRALLNREVTLEEIYRAASEIEAIHARAGFILVRAAVPPQNLSNGGTLKIIIVDGFIERIDVAEIPKNTRKSVAARTASLMGKRHITLSALEQPILIAGGIPGLSMKSTLERGTQYGGATLVLAGKYKLISGSIGGDNSLAPLLGRYGINGQVSVNSAFGYGEQIYGFISSGYDLTKLLSADNPVRVIGGGIVFPSYSGRFSFNPEITFARTQPLPQAGVPQTRGVLTRISLRSTHILYKTRPSSFILNAALEHVDEANDVPLFNVRISQDRFGVARLGFTSTYVQSDGAYLSISGRVSRGIGSAPAANTVLQTQDFSRLGSRKDFTKTNVDLMLSSPIAQNWRLDITAKGQSTFGKPVFRSEQISLEGNDALSAFVGGATAADEGAVVRIEIARPSYSASARGVYCVPYGFIASGYGRINMPTALESSRIQVAAFGVGLRLTVPRAGSNNVGLNLEYAHGIADSSTFHHTNRFNAAISFRF